jgi:hypothetical protein
MGEKPKRCWYPILMIVMCIRLILKASVSFRAAPKAIHTVFSHFPSVKNQPIPSHKTVGRWLTRLGLYKLNSPKEPGDDWALIVDNSIQAGATKCLLILGARLGKLKGKPLEFADVEVLLMELHENPNKNIVCRSLEKAQEKVGKVAMVCADDGPDLRSGIEMFCKKHGVGRVFDTIHKIGTILKRLLGNNPKWQTFVQAAAEAKKKMQQTPAAHLMPPNQRTKSRFLNIEILTQWAVNALAIISNPCHPDKELLENYCGWLVEYKELVERLKQFDLINKCVRQHIRERGISLNTGEQIEVLLHEAMKGVPLNEMACQYAGELIDFFSEQSKIVPLGHVWIGSSEIIESLFGKLKCLEQNQHKSGFTSLVLAMAACVGSLDPQVVQAAMLKITTKDVEAWTKRQLGTTLLSKRRKAFGTGRRYKIKKIKRKFAGTFLDEAVGF